MPKPNPRLWNDKCRKRLKTGGFTLLELMLALSITAIIILLVFGIFRMGIRAWERGERDIEDLQRIRISIHMMGRQLASLSATASFTQSDATMAFDGDEGHVTFVSMLPFDPKFKNQAVLCHYAVEQGDDGVNLYSVEMLSSALFSQLDADSLQEKRRHLLISGARSIRFDYLYRMDASGSEAWEKKWISGAENNFQVLLPQAVRAQIETREPGPPVTVIFPIRSREPA